MPDGFEFAFGTNWVCGDPILNVRIANGVLVVKKAVYAPQPHPQPRLPAEGQEGLVLQLSQALEAAFGTRAEKDEKPLRSLVAPHFGQTLAASCKLRAR